MDKKAFALVQHILIPLALIAGNLAICQFIYQLTNTTNYVAICFTGVSLVMVTVGVLRAHRDLLMISALVCLINLIWVVF